MDEIKKLSALAYELRKDVVDMIVEGKGGHIGGDMSVMDILVSLYFKEMNISPENKDDENRDRFILSKGHSVEAYYAVLAAKGFFPKKEVMEQFSRFGTPYIGCLLYTSCGICLSSAGIGHACELSDAIHRTGKSAPYQFHSGAYYQFCPELDLNLRTVWHAQNGSGRSRCGDTGLRYCKSLHTVYFSVEGQQNGEIENKGYVQLGRWFFQSLSEQMSPHSLQ